MRRHRFSARREARELQGSGDYVRVVAKAGEPVHVGFLAEPGDLALGEAARGLLDLLDRLRGLRPPAIWSRKCE